MPSQAIATPALPQPARTGLREGGHGGRGASAAGLALCCAVALAAMLAARAEQAVFGHVVLEPLVLAILLGAVLRSLWAPPASWRGGIDLGGRVLMEAGVAALGAGMDVRLLLREGWHLPAAIACLVCLGLAGGYGLCRALGLRHRPALLVACGNAICGNSTIAACAPVIGAEASEVASAIACTAVLGAGLALILPPLAGLLHLSPHAGGVLAGMTVYAVPQVLAACLPMGLQAMQTGTLVKLMRVLMLGPVLLTLALGQQAPARKPGLAQALPWFICVFGVLMALRAAGCMPAAAAKLAASLASPLSLVGMAALGLAVDPQSLARSARRTGLAALLCLVFLASLAFALLHIFTL